MKEEGRSYFRSPQKNECHSHFAPFDKKEWHSSFALYFGSGSLTHCLVESNYKWKMGQNFVAFSEYLNLHCLILDSTALHFASKSLAKSMHYYQSKNLTSVTNFSLQTLFIVKSTPLWPPIKVFITKELC